MTKPFLMIDVDGPLNPSLTISQAKRNGFERHVLNPMTGDGLTWRQRYGMGLRVFLSRTQGEELVKLADVFDLVWATTWEHEANLMIGPRIGLPRLPVIEFEGRLPSVPPEPGLHWKTAVIAAYAEEHQRSFVWVDDEVGHKDEVYFAKHVKRPSLALRIDPFTGLTAAHFADLRKWGEGVTHGG